MGFKYLQTINNIATKKIHFVFNLYIQLFLEKKADCYYNNLSCIKNNDSKTVSLKILLNLLS